MKGKLSMKETNGKKGSLAEQLENRRWPEAAQGVITGDYDMSPYVREGRVFSRALRIHQQVSEPIPAGESAVTSLCTGKNGKIYGATSGKQSHLFYYDPSPAGDGIVDLGVLEGVKAVRRALADSGEGRIFAGASEVEDPKGEGALYEHETKDDYSDEFRSLGGETRKLLVPVKGECIAALCADTKRKMLYGISSKTGTFFRYDYVRGTVKSFGPVSKDRAFSRCLVMDEEGNVYGTHSLGTLWHYSPEDEQVVDLEVRIPSVAGREFYNALDSAVYEPNTGLIYGAGTADGVLFTFDPETLDVCSLGKVTAEPRVRAITATPDGRVFGISGCEEGMGHLFCYQPLRHELTDLGILFASSEVFRRGFEFDAACCGKNGELYFGEAEREGHLFLYFPSIPDLSALAGGGCSCDCEH